MFLKVGCEKEGGKYIRNRKQNCLLNINVKVNK